MRILLLIGLIFLAACNAITPHQEVKVRSGFVENNMAHTSFKNCQEYFDYHPRSVSGNYSITLPDGIVTSMYCNFDDFSEVWTRVLGSTEVNSARINVLGSTLTAIGLINDPTYGFSFGGNILDPLLFSAENYCIDLDNIPAFHEIRFSVTGYRDFPAGGEGTLSIATGDYGDLMPTYSFSDPDSNPASDQEEQITAYERLSSGSLSYISTANFPLSGDLNLPTRRHLIAPGTMIRICMNGDVAPIPYTQRFILNLEIR